MKAKSAWRRTGEVVRDLDKDSREERVEKDWRSRARDFDEDSREERVEKDWRGRARDLDEDSREERVEQVQRRSKRYAAHTRCRRVCRLVYKLVGGENDILSNQLSRNTSYAVRQGSTYGFDVLQPLGLFGWQGIVPAKAAQMSESIVTMVTTKLVNVQDVFMLLSRRKFHLCF